MKGKEEVRVKIWFEEYDADWGRCNVCGCTIGREGLRKLKIREETTGNVMEYAICYSCLNRLALQCLTELNVTVKAVAGTIGETNSGRQIT